jgi:hypothetical protein
LRLAARNRWLTPGLVFHSDRGVEYAAFEHREDASPVRHLAEREPTGQDQRQRAHGIVLTKAEELYGKTFSDDEQLRRALSSYVTFFNQQRLHSSLLCTSLRLPSSSSRASNHAPTDMPWQRLLIETLKAGTIASLAMMPFGFAFRVAGMRVGYYGPKFAGLFVESPTPVFLFAQHIILGWVSALPLLLLLSNVRQPSPMFLGAAYGVAYYVLVNSLALPLYFGDPTPWQLGVAQVFPSLVVHVVFGVCVSYVSRHIAVSKHNGG